MRCIWQLKLLRKVRIVLCRARMYLQLANANFFIQPRLIQESPVSCYSLNSLGVSVFLIHVG